MTSKALVIFSGGQDSTTCAAIAKQVFDEVHALTINYGQRHIFEIQAAKQVATALALDSHEIIDLGRVLVSSSPLVSSNAVGVYETIEDLPGGVEPTFVPGRNALFLTIAANRAAALGAEALYAGLCQEDFGGYFDCRQEFVDAMSIALAQGFVGGDSWLKIETPLMNLSKADSVRLAFDILGAEFERVMELTHTCYNGVKGGCGKCHACHLRDRGFREAGIDDPLWKYRSAAA